MQQGRSFGDVCSLIGNWRPAGKLESLPAPVRLYACAVVTREKNKVKAIGSMQHPN